MSKNELYLKVWCEPLAGFPIKRGFTVLPATRFSRTVWIGQL